MKVKELIAKLQEADPTGELPVCVGNIDVWYVEKAEAYWDGNLEQLDRSDSKFYNIIGGKVIASGCKVQIRTLSISDAIWEDPDIPVEFVGMSEENKERYSREIEICRDETRKFDNELKEKRERIVQEKE